MENGYIVTTSGRNGMSLFLVDRRRIKNRWWSYAWHDAFIFQKQSAAQIQADKLRYKKPTVVTVHEASAMSNNNSMSLCDDHPFSSDAIGQS